jgi:hypothetical protein
MPYHEAHLGRNPPSFYAFPQSYSFYMALPSVPTAVQLDKNRFDLIHFGLPSTSSLVLDMQGYWISRCPGLSIFVASAMMVPKF